LLQTTTSLNLHRARFVKGIEPVAADLNNLAFRRRRNVVSSRVQSTPLVRFPQSQKHDSSLRGGEADEAIQKSTARVLDCFATLAMTLVALYHQIAIPGSSPAQ
jgi:hypothetical protein